MTESLGQLNYIKLLQTGPSSINLKKNVEMWKQLLINIRDMIICLGI